MGLRKKIIMITGVTLLLLAGRANAIPMLKLELQDTTIGVGQSFIVNVLVDGVNAVDPIFGVDQLLAFGFDVFNSPSITFEGATIGGDFFDDSLFFTDTDVAGSAFPGVSGDNILLASLQFVADIKGELVVGVFSDLLDPNEGLFTLLSPPLDLSTFAYVTIPAPPMALIVFFAAIGMCLTRKRSLVVSPRPDASYG